MSRKAYRSRIKTLILFIKFTKNLQRKVNNPHSAVAVFRAIRKRKLNKVVLKEQIIMDIMNWKAKDIKDKVKQEIMLRNSSI